MNSKYIIIKPRTDAIYSGATSLHILTSPISRLEVIEWHKENKDDEALVIKADSIKDFVNKSQ